MRISQDLLTAFDELLAEFIAMRGRERRKIASIIQQRLDGITVRSRKSAVTNAGSFTMAA